jgi:rhamnosyltransferase subunit B
MSRFVFSAVGSLGDLHPYIAIGRALIARGHQAVVAAAPDYAAAVESAGVEFAPVRPGFADLGLDPQTLAAALFDARRGPERLIRSLVMPHVRSAYDHQWRAAMGADLLVSHPLAVTMPLLALRRQLPWVSTVLAPLSLMSCEDPPTLAPAPWLRKLRGLGAPTYRWLFRRVKSIAWDWEEPLRDLRDQLGLPRSPELALFEGQFSPLRNLALFDSQLASPQSDWPVGTRICGSCLFDGGAVDEETAESLRRFLDAGDEPIVFALGTSAVWVAGDFWHKAAEAAATLGRRSILVTGTTLPQDLPGGSIAFRYLPYSLVFPRAAAVVHQAGIGTLAQALRAGRPQLLLPLAFDQPDNARRACELGLARTLPFERASVPRLVRELKLLLEQPRYLDAAQSVARSLDGDDGAGRAADELIACLDAARSTG